MSVNVRVRLRKCPRSSARWVIKVDVDPLSRLVRAARVPPRARPSPPCVAHPGHSIAAGTVASARVPIGGALIAADRNVIAAEAAEGGLQEASVMWAAESQRDLLMAREWPEAGMQS
jgi:hypothetical protein